MRRMLGVLMALCMLFTMAQPFAMADGDPTLTVGPATIEAGGTGKVQISVTNDPGMAALKIRLSYDTAALEITSSEQGDIGSQFKSASFVAENGVGNWNILDGTENVTGDGVLLTLTFSAKGAVGEYPVTFAVEEAYDYDDEDITFAVVPGTVTISGEPGPAPAEEYDITYASSENGTVSGPAKATEGTEVAVTVTPDEGYVLDTLKANGEDVKDGKFTMPDEAVTVTATFKGTEEIYTPDEEHDITYASAENGTVSGPAKAAKDTEVTVTVTPDDGYELDTLKANGEDVTGGKFTMPAGAVTVTATFKAVEEPAPGAEEYDITYASAENGTVSGPAKAAEGAEVTVTATPNEGYELDTLKANDEDVTGGKFTMPAEAVTVTATFKAVEEPAPGDEEYDITYASAENGTVSGPAKAAEGAEVTVTVTPDDGYELDALKVNGTDVTGNKFTMPGEAVTVTATFKATTEPDKPRSEGGCYIATSVYGSYDAPEVWTLRRFRDETLADTWYGRLFIKAYYAVSPTLVRLFGDDGWFQEFWRDRLDTMVGELQEAGYESAPYQDLDW